MKKLSDKKINKLKKRAKMFIPAGAHTYSKADEQFSANTPPFVVKAKNARFIDLKGKEYIDYGMGIFSVSLGHAYQGVNNEIKKQLKKGNSFSRPSILEGELAEHLCHLIPRAEMVKFAKNGSDVTSAAIRLARAFTGKEYVVRCSQQPFHSFNDWFIGSTSKSGGIPKNIQNQTLRFDYNNIDALNILFDQYPDQIACVIMEPMTFEEPKAGFLDKVKKLCHQNGSLLIFDEIITGFRWHLQGAQKYFNVIPDLATFGKGMSNGYAAAALVGRKEIMKPGDFDQNVFLLSCTYGSEMIGLTAIKHTIKTMENLKVIEHYRKYGKKVIQIINEYISEFNLSKYVKTTGFPCRPEILYFDDKGRYSFELKTLFVQEMIRMGVFMERIAISYTHGKKELKITDKALAHTFKTLKKALDKGDINKSIDGHCIKPVFTY